MQGRGRGKPLPGRVEDCYYLLLTTYWLNHLSPEGWWDLFLDQGIIRGPSRHRKSFDRKTDVSFFFKEFVVLTS